jgi:chitinase
MWSKDTGMFSTYEDERSVGLKAQYVKDRGLGGVMFWESSADRPIG